MRVRPVIVDGLGEQTVRISAGPFHCAAINAVGELYTWGWNKWGQLGTGDTFNSHVPRLVSGMQGMDVSIVACGPDYTVAVTDTILNASQTVVIDRVHIDYFNSGELSPVAGSPASLTPTSPYTPSPRSAVSLDELTPIDTLPPQPPSPVLTASPTTSPNATPADATAIDTSRTRCNNTNRTAIDDCSQTHSEYLQRRTVTALICHTSTTLRHFDALAIKVRNYFTGDVTSIIIIGATDSADFIRDASFSSNDTARSFTLRQSCPHRQC